MNLDCDTMDRFEHAGLEIAFLDNGRSDAPAVLLIHGFASTAHVNWVAPGWFRTLGEAGYRVVALDNRGHGESSKPHDPDAYHPDLMASDAVALLDHLAIAEAHVMGYSMGARISAFLAHLHPDRVRSVAFGGLGANMVDGVGNWDPIAEALLADDPATITDRRARMFRAFADQTKSDRLALAACIRTSRMLVTPDMLYSMTMPTLVAVGTRDEIAGSPHQLAASLPAAQAIEIPDRDHMLAVGDKVFKSAVLEFYATIEGARL